MCVAVRVLCVGCNDCVCFVECACGSLVVSYIELYAVLLCVVTCFCVFVHLYCVMFYGLFCFLFAFVSWILCLFETHIWLLCLWVVV